MPSLGPLDVLRFHTPTVSDFSCLGTHPRALCRVIQTGQMPRCFALSNEKPEETRSECPSTEITGISALKNIFPPQLLPLRPEEFEVFRNLLGQHMPRDRRGGQGRPIWEMMKRGVCLLDLPNRSHFHSAGFCYTDPAYREGGQGRPLLQAPRGQWSQQVLGAATSSGKVSLD